MTPLNQSFWTVLSNRAALFIKHDARSQNWFFATLGAGSDAPLPNACGGHLRSEANRDRDVTAPPYSEKEFERLSYPMGFENELINRLFVLDDAYADNLDYECYPDKGEQEYNSNGYVSGLLKAAGITLPAFPADIGEHWPLYGYSGWDQPVPEEKFR